MDFTSVIAPMQVSEFAQLVVDGHPIYIPGTADKFTRLFSKEAFWKCVTQGKREGVDLPRVSLTSYQLPLAFEKGAISRALRSGNTVCTSHIDRASESLRQLCLNAEEVLGFPGSASVHCYYSPPGTGYSFFHLDSGVAITLQLEGKKTWQYSDRPAVPWSIRVGGYREGGRLEWFGESDWQPQPGTVPSAEDQGFVQRTLTPGDVLVMPPGVWHNVSASDSTSISLNLKLTAAPAIDGIFQVVRQTFLHEERWRRPFPFAAQEELRSGALSKKTMQEVKEILLSISKAIAELAEDEDGLSRLWFRNFLGNQGTVEGRPDNAIKEGDVLSVPSGIRPRISVGSDGNTALLGQGKILQIRGRSVAELLRELLERRYFVVGDSSSWKSAQTLNSMQIEQVMQKLVDAGFLQIDEGTKPAP